MVGRGGKREGAGRKRNSGKGSGFYCKKLKPDGCHKIEGYFGVKATQGTHSEDPDIPTENTSLEEARESTTQGLQETTDEQPGVSGNSGRISDSSSDLDYEASDDDKSSEAIDAVDEQSPEAIDAVDEQSPETIDAVDEQSPEAIDAVDEQSPEEVRESAFPLNQALQEFEKGATRDWMVYRTWQICLVHFTKTGWLCCHCSSFSLEHKKGVAWIEVGAKLGDHPTRAVKRHEESSIHQKAVKNRQMFLTMQNRYSSVVEMLQSRSVDEADPNYKRQLLSIFVRITLFMLKKHWAHTQNFEDLVKLIAKCGSKLLEKHVYCSKKNASWLSKTSVGKYVAGISNFIEGELLASIRMWQYYTLLLDETTDVCSHNQLAVSCIFPHKGVVKEHFMGMIDTTNHLPHHNAQSIKQLVEQFLQQKGIAVANMMFLCTDTTNVMSGCRQGLRTLFQRDTAPAMIWVGCMNHLLALYFVHLSKQFKIITSVDATLLALWKKFHFSSVATGYLVQVSRVYEEEDVKPAKPSATRWLSHGKACKEFLQKQEVICTTLATLYNERSDHEAYGILAQLTENDFMLTTLLLSELLNGPIKHLTLVLEKSAQHLSVSEVEKALDLTLQNLTNMIEGVRECKTFCHEQFAEVRKIAETCVLNIRRLHKQSEEDPASIFESYERNTAVPLLAALKSDIEDSLVLPKEVKALSIVDPRNIPDQFSQLRADPIQSWINECIETLLAQYQTLSRTDLTAEKEHFFDLMIHKKQKALVVYDQQVEKMPAATLEEQEKKLKAAQTRNSEAYKVKHLYDDIQNDSSLLEQFPNFFHLVLLYMLLPFSSSSVERVFSQLKLTKTALRNRLSEGSLDQLLRVSIEGPNELSSEALASIVDDICRRHPNMRL